MVDALKSEIGNQRSFTKWLENLDNDVRLLILAILIGIIGGLGAVAFRLLIDGFNYILVTLPLLIVDEFNGSSLKSIVTVLAPAIGGLIVGALIYYLAREAKGHGVPEIVESVNINNGKMRMRVPFVKIIASAITIGSGGSAGREGPIAQIGGGFASVLSQKFHLSAEESKILVVSGVSAGIAATFNAPLGGVLFGLEVIRRDLRAFNVLPLVTSSVIGTAVGEYFLGKNPAFIFPQTFSFNNIYNIPIFVILGILMGVVSVFWVKGFYFIEDLLEKIPTTPIFLAGLGGLGIGFIELFYPEITGTSYQAIDDAFALKLTLQIALILAFVKFLGTALSIGSGGSGGVFAPTLFMGVMLGIVLGNIIQMVGYTNIGIPVVALLCMAALFAGSARAPLAAIVLTSEMVNDFKLIIPLMFAVMSAWIVSKMMMEDDIYIIKLKRRGVEFITSVDVLEDIPVSKIMVEKPIYVSSKDRLETVIEVMKSSGHTGFPVVEDGKLVGIITSHDVSMALDKVDLKEWIVGDVCTKKVITIVQTAPISTALLTMAERHINRLPVIKSKTSRKLVGWVTRSDIMTAYWSAKSRKIYQEFEKDLFSDLDEGILEMY